MKKFTILFPVIVIFLCFSSFIFCIMEKSLSSGALIQKYADEIDVLFMGVLGGLQELTKTKEAIELDWKVIQQSLNQFANELPGSYFLVLPDGSYYTSGLGLTDFNLIDSDYFIQLFEGETVKGFPAYGKLTGKKSACVAVPIFYNNEVIGALGALIFLDDLQPRLNNHFSFPENYTWFVLDYEGNTMLDKDKDYMFMNALTQGTESLKSAVEEILENKSGQVRYELGGGVRKAEYVRLENLPWWLVIASVHESEPGVSGESSLLLQRFINEFQKKVSSIIDSGEDTISANVRTLYSEKDIRKILRKVKNKNTSIVNSAFVNLQGEMKYFEPPDYKKC